MDKISREKKNISQTQTPIFGFYDSTKKEELFLQKRTKLPHSACRYCKKQQREQQNKEQKTVTR